MNIFENEKYFEKDSYDGVSYADQKQLFMRIRNWVNDIDDKTKENADLYASTVIARIERICSYACAGHIPSQDYMGYIYKRGFLNIFPVNYSRSVEWNIIASANGSKLAPEKMRAFLNPCIDDIIFHEQGKKIINFYGLDIYNYFWFLGQHICEFMYKDLRLNQEEMAKKDLIEKDEDEEKARILFDRYRDKSAEHAIKVLVEQIPKDYEVKEKEIDVSTEEMLNLKTPKSKVDAIFEDVDIEDIE